MVNFLLGSGAETLYSDSKERTVLHYASIIGVSKGIMQVILDFNDRYDMQGNHMEEAL